MLKLPSWLSRTVALVLLPALLIALNAWLVRGWFTGEYPSDLGAIDTAYVQAGRFVSELLGASHWVPYWYGGFPLHVLYNPVFPHLAWALQAVTHWPFGQVERTLGAVGYVLTPAALYVFLRALTRRPGVALAAGLAATFLPSLSYLLFRDANGVGPGDYAALYGYGPWRFAQLTMFGEATHTFAMPFVPLAGWGFVRLFQRVGFGRAVTAGALLALVALSSMIAFFAALLLVTALTTAELFAGRLKPGQVLTAGGAAALVAAGLAAFWFNPQFLSASFAFGEGGSILGNYLKGVGLVPLSAALVFAALFWIFHRRVRLAPMLAGLFWFVPLFLFAFVWYRARIALAPQPIRYIPEMDLALLVLAAGVVSAVLSYLPKRSVGWVIGATVTLALIAVAVLPGRAFFSEGPKRTEPRDAPISESYEYQSVTRVAQTAGSQRVYVSGNNAFYLNAFTDTPQLRGALDQAALNRWWPHLSYQLLTNEASISRGQARAVAEAIVQAEDLGYVLVETAGSGDPFKTDWKHPEVYAAWTPVWTERGDTLYRAPLKLPGPFQVVDRSAAARLKPPSNGADLSALAAYAAWVDGRAEPVQSFAWRKPGRADIQATIRSGQALSAQLTYAAGWRAKSSVGGHPRVRSDALGNLVVEGLPEGSQTITLSYGKPLMVYVGYVLTLLTLIALAFYPRIIRPWFASVRARAAAADVELKRRHREELRSLGIDR